jgi:hypothetical protein
MKTVVNKVKNAALLTSFQFLNPEKFNGKLITQTRRGLGISGLNMVAFTEPRYVAQVRENVTGWRRQPRWQ